VDSLIWLFYPEIADSIVVAPSLRSCILADAMERRSLLLNSLSRAPLRLLSEMDPGLRAAQRAAAADPGDEEARARASHLTKRSGPPDKEHNWRFNGKGWFTRPQWNNGRCPPDSKPTQHNTCIGDNDSDSHQYKVRDAKQPPARNPTAGDNDRAPRWKRRAEIGRTPEVENSPLSTKPGSKINWEHPHGPRIYQPYENEKPRSLPDSPEHLPKAIAQPITGYPRSRQRQERERSQEKLVKHYTDRGYDEKYVRSTLNSREPAIDLGSVSDSDMERLPPDRLSRFRALRKQGAKKLKQREAEHAAYVQGHIDQHGYAPHEGWEDEGYNDYDDGYDDDRYSQDDPILGGYDRYPDYPGHPDYPEFDGQPSEIREPTNDNPDDYDPYSRWGRRLRPPPGNPESEFTGPTWRSEPTWPRTGERRNPGDQESPDQFANPRSGRGRGSNRTSGRSHMGGGRGRTNFRGRGGRRR
jgi:hypothetical protein